VANFIHGSEVKSAIGLRIFPDWLIQASETGFNAFVGDRQIALDAVVADDVGMRIPGFALCQRGELHLGSVVIRVVRQDDVGAGFFHDIAKTPCRTAVGFKPEAVGSFRCDIDCSVSKPVECCASPLGRKMRFAVVLHRNKRGYCAERMTGR